MILETRHFITSAFRRNLWRCTCAEWSRQLDPFCVIPEGATPCFSPWNTSRSSTSIFPYPHFLHKSLPSPHPKAEAGSSNPLTPFPSSGMLPTPWATKDYSLSLSPPEAATLPICSLVRQRSLEPVSWRGRRVGCSASHSLSCPRKGSQLNVGTGFDTPAANWAMLLQHIPAMSSVKWYSRSTDVVWWLALAPQHSWSVQHAHLTFSLFIWLKNDEYTAFLLCRNLGQFSLLAQEQRLWYNFHTILQACKGICYSACVDCLSACKHVCPWCFCALKMLYIFTL